MKSPYNGGETAPSPDAIRYQIKAQNQVWAVFKLLTCGILDPLHTQTLQATATHN